MASDTDRVILSLILSPYLSCCFVRALTCTLMVSIIRAEFWLSRNKPSCFNDLPDIIRIELCPFLEFLLEGSPVDSIPFE